MSEADKQAMLRIAPQAKITVISNGIDLDDYRPTPGGIYAVYPQAAKQSPKLRALVQFLQEHLPPRLA